MQRAFRLALGLVALGGEAFLRQHLAAAGLGAVIHLVAQLGVAQALVGGADRALAVGGDGPVAGGLRVDGAAALLEIAVELVLGGALAGVILGRAGAQRGDGGQDDRGAGQI